MLNMSNESNRGDLAILESIVYLAKKHFPNCKIQVLNVDNDKQDIERGKQFKYLTALGVNHHGSFLPRVLNEGKKLRVILSGCWHVVVSIWVIGSVFIFRKYASFIIPKRHQEAFNAIRIADVVVLKGGSYLYSYGGIKNFLFLYRMLLPSIVSIWLGKKILALGLSIGPVVDKPSRALLIYCLKRFHKVVLRECISHRYVLDELMLDRRTVELMPDMAFWKSRPEEGHRECSKARTILETAAKDSDWLDKLKIGLTVRKWNFPLQDNPRERFNNYCSSIVSVITQLHTEYGARVFIMPQAHSDMALGQLIAEKAKVARPIVIQGDYSTSVLREIYGLIDIFIGTRTHSNIFALSMGTPVIAIAYEIPKGYGIVSMLENDGCILDITKISEKELLRKVQNILSKKDVMRNAICKKVAIMQQTIEEKYVEFIESTLKANHTGRKKP